MVEILQAVCKDAKLTCTTQIMPWRRALAMAESGQVDGIFSILHGPEKAQNFVLSEPIIRTAYSFFAPKGSGWSYTTPSNLKDMTIGVYGPSSTSITLNALVATGSNTKVVLELSNFDALLSPCLDKICATSPDAMFCRSARLNATISSVWGDFLDRPKQ